MENVFQFPKNRELLIEEAASYLGISARTLRNRIFQQKGPRVTKRFGRLRFVVADLDAYKAAEGKTREAGA